MTTTPTLDQLKRGLAISEQIAALEAEMASIFNGAAPSSTAKATPPQSDGRKGKRSPATIAKMKASQQARWAKIKGAKAPAKAKAETTAKQKRKPMSPETKAKLAAAMTQRWTYAKAGKSPVPTVSKK